MSRQSARNRWGGRLLALSALLAVAAGAALPYAVSGAQDLRTGETMEVRDLSTVNLTLRQEGDLLSSLRLVLEPHDESPWAGRTALSPEEAGEAAAAAMVALNGAGLLSPESATLVESEEYAVSPFLFTAWDGTSALFWMVEWDPADRFDSDQFDESSVSVSSSDSDGLRSSSWGVFVTIDDATGKAVRILAERPQVDENSPETAYAQADTWCAFLQDYYDMTLENMSANGPNADGSLPLLFEITFNAEDEAGSCKLRLEIEDDLFFLNYL